MHNKKINLFVTLCLLTAVLLVAPITAGATLYYDMMNLDKYYSDLHADDVNARDPMRPKAVIVNGKATVYTLPLGEKDVVGSVAEGALVEIIQWHYSGAYARILYNTNTNAGWVKAEHISVIK